jgi:hypothetical protein
MGHMRYLLGLRPHEAPSLAGHLDETENALVGLLGRPLFLSALALVTGGSRERAGAAVPAVAALYRRLADEHAARRRAVGLASDDSPLAAFVGEFSA